jgi:hypothetical protein
MNNKKILFFSILFIFILNVGIVNAIRISPAMINIDFEPNYEKSYTFTTEKSEGIDVYFEGDLAEYASLGSNNIAQDGTFIVQIKLPEFIDQPGNHRILVGLIEVGVGGTATVSGIASIKAPINIKVPYIGLYAEVMFKAHDLNENETSNFQIEIDNLGVEGIKELSSKIDFFDAGNKLVDTLHIEKGSVEPRSKKSFLIPINASKYGPGEFRGAATVNYDGNTKESLDSFRIGTLSINLVDYTKKFQKDRISNYEIELESKWNSKIKSVSAQVVISNETGEVSSFRTISVDLNPWEKIKISTFWDNSGLGAGTYDSKIILTYNDKSDTHNSKIEIVSPEVKLNFFNKYLNLTNALVLVAALLIVINLLIVIMRRKR